MSRRFRLAACSSAFAAALAFVAMPLASGTVMAAANKSAAAKKGSAMKGGAMKGGAMKSGAAKGSGKSAGDPLNAAAGKKM